MNIFKLNVGYNLRRHPQDAIICALLAFFTAGPGTMLALILLALPQPDGYSVNPLELLTAPLSALDDQPLCLRLLTSLLIAIRRRAPRRSRRSSGRSRRLDAYAIDGTVHPRIRGRPSRLLRRQR